MTLRRVVIATKNPDKAGEIRTVVLRVFPGVEIVDGLSWDDIAETGATLEENATLKARTVARATGLPALADDTGLEVDALDGAPGVHTARFAGPAATYAENRAALLAAMDGLADRHARFRTVVALVDGDALVTASGSVEGTIALHERGSGGFGYDPIFEVEGRTMAEIGVVEKNRLSHRARAIEALLRRLAESE